MRFPDSITPVHFDEVASTNDTARTLARAGAAHFTLVYADTQTHGRGRHQRVWKAAAGNLFASVVVRPSVDWPEVTTLGHVVAIAIYDTIAAILSQSVSIRIKWPNDILVNGGKISGILIEAENAVQRSRGQQGIEFLVVGIGLNIASTPQIDAAYAATSLADHGGIVSRDHLLCRLSTALVQNMERWLQGGFAALAPRYKALTHQHGEALAIAPGADRSNAIRGHFHDINAMGQLILRCDNGRLQHFSAGDVIGL